MKPTEPPQETYVLSGIEGIHNGLTVLWAGAADIDGPGPNIPIQIVEHAGNKFLVMSPITPHNWSPVYDLPVKNVMPNRGYNPLTSKELEECF